MLVTERFRGRRQLWLSLFDCGAWGLALSIAAWARMDFAAALVPWSHVLIVWVIVATTHIAMGWVGHLHHGRAALGSLEEMMLLGLVTAAAGSTLFAINAVLPTFLLPRSVPLVAGFMAIAVMSWGRASWRRWSEYELKRSPEGDDERAVLILGAGDAGRQLIRSMQRDAPRNWLPVALLDDDLRKRHLRMHGVPVLGTSDDIAEAAASTGASMLVVAIPSANAALIRKASDAAATADLDVKVLPAVSELFDDRVDIRDMRDVEITDLLGRHQVEVDLEAIAGYLTGQRVLVTGAGGSIGSELCRQIHRWSPAELIMLDRDESALHAVQLSIHGRAMLDTDEVVLGDIRDTMFLNDLFARRRPHVVFHAAALKHLPMLEQYPGEAVKTNVWGTLSILEAATAHGVEKFVNISTDKAANPTSVLGYSKRIAEGLTSAIAAESAGTYLSVRFGNVLGSRGSVFVAFAAQIAVGGPVTVTHPEVTRFFMTVQEAVQLVIQAAAIGGDGEALVLDMGQPVRIDDVARQLIEFSGRRIDIQYTGLRKAEKMHEDLFGEGELDRRPVHPLVSHVRVPHISPTDARTLDPWQGRSMLVRDLAGVCRDMDTLRAASAGYGLYSVAGAGAEVERALDL